MKNKAELSEEQRYNRWLVLLTVVWAALAAFDLLTGCAAPPDEALPDDVEEPTPEPEPEPDPTPEPEPACDRYTVAPVENWGPGMTPSIAGSDEGYAVVYAEWFVQAGFVRMVGPDGTPTSPVQNLPVDQHSVFAQVTHGRNGYLVNGSDIGTYGGENLQTVYMMDQSGAVTRVYGPVRDLWNWGLSGGDALDWAVNVLSFPGSGLCETGTLASFWAFNPDGTANGYGSICLEEPGYTHTSLTLGFAARGGGFAIGADSHRETPGPNNPVIDKHRIKVVTFDGDALRETVLAELNGEGNLSITRIAATGEGYAVRWRRLAVPGIGTLGGDDGYLTFLGPKGEFIRSVRLAHADGDIAWNGREIGEAAVDPEDKTIIFSRYDADGVLIDETIVAVTDVHYLSRPKIAAGEGFAVVWGESDFTTPTYEVDLMFVPVICD
jgi:hypothetical protein